VRVAIKRECPKLLLATSNTGKLAEFRDLLGGKGWQLLEPAQIDLMVDVEETGVSYSENAASKAKAWAAAAGCWALADDSGLEVAALDGAPGLFSARFAGPERTDAQRRRFLLGQLAAHTKPWQARFVASVAFANPAGFLALEQGICVGEIIDKERGTSGFGYDPIFLVEDTGKTMAELTMEQKNQVSHRARAVKAVLPILQEKLGMD